MKFQKGNPMNIHRRLLRTIVLFNILLLLALAVSACNLTAAPEEQLDVTNVPTNDGNPTRTPSSNSNLPTARAVTQLPVPTSRVPFGGTAVSVLPQPILLPTITPLPLSIVILSPIPGNVVASNVQVLGAASHPQFLQYQLEYGPDNPSNLWYPATGIIQTPVTTYGLLGIWNTTTFPDGVYQLRLRVFLRDGSNLTTVVNNIRVQNQAPTPIPTATLTIPRPIAAFTQDRATGNAPLVVRFFNQSSGDITSYNWNFGDGGLSSESNPVHTYNAPGLYNVTLTVNGAGGSSNVSRQISVQSVSAPVAAFTQDRASGPPPLNVQFTNQSTGAITTYAWNFGDGAISDQPSPSHQYMTVGTYNVILQVVGPGGSSSATRQITVTNTQIPPPVAAFTPNTPISGDVQLTVQFENTSTGNITSYNWNFGDGTGSVEENPAHIFTAADQYTVILTVVGPGGQDTAEITVEVIQPPDAPTASFDIQGESSGNAPFTVTFSNTSQGNIEQTLWDFGDGQTSDSADATITHEFADAGTYNVTLTVSNTSGNDAFTSTITALAEEQPLTALFIANPTGGTAPVIITFTNQSTGDNLTFQWNFGDNTTGSNSEASFTHEYASAGNYTVTLTATDRNTGNSDDYQLPIQISAPVQQPPLTADFTAVENPALTFTFTAAASGGTAPYTFTWDFGDGQVGNGESVIHTYATGTEYDVQLTVADSAGTTPAVSNQTITATSPSQPITANFTAVEDPALTFTLNATASGGVAPYTFTWDFGDSQVGNGQSVSHTYAVGGPYPVRLTVTDSIGSTPAIVDQMLTATSAAQPLSASFNAVEDPALTFTFNATVSGGTEPYTLTWDFGDGQFGDGQSTTHTYAAGGTYTVILAVTDATGATTSSEQDITATAAAEPGLQESTPILPTNIGSYFNTLNPVYQAGLVLPVPNRRDAFTIVGDDTAASAAFLRPFANNTPPTYLLDDTTSSLQALIDQFNTTSSFTHVSVAAGAGFTAQTLLDPGNIQSGQCDQPGETLIQCELRLAQASIVIINIGYADTLQQTDPTAFSNQLAQIIQTALNSGVVPIVNTIYPRTGDATTFEQTRLINDAIINTANAMNVPIFNQWLAFNGLPDSGLYADNTPTVDTSVTEGAGFLTAATTFGANLRNYYMLTLLDLLYNSVLR